MIYIDRQILFFQPRGGISTYANQLAYEFMPEATGFSGSLLNSSLRNQLELIQNAPMYKLVHHTYHFPFFVPGKIKRVVTLHDTATERGFTDGGWRKPFSLFLKRRQIMEADGIVAVSNSTLEDAISCYPEILKKPRRVIYHGVDNHLNLPALPKYQIKMDQPFLLFVGKRHNYKNFQVILKAFEKSQELKARFCLLAVGGEALSLDEKEAMNRLGNKFQHWENVDNEELLTLYRTCSAYVSSSLIEGFGLPIIEALSCGARCVCSAIPVYKELYHGRTEFFDPYEWRSFAEVVLSPSNIRPSETLGFSKKKMLSDHRDFYEEVCETLWK
jgi:glycosyltransferase involved in cell wall biosynthesis